MTLWRRVLPTIVRVSLVSAFVGTSMTLVATASHALQMFTDHVPSVFEPMETLGARCAAEPAGFSATLASGDVVTTFDLDRLPAGEAGPEPEMLAKVRGGASSAMKMIWFRDPGGILLFPRGTGGPCSLIEVRWRVDPMARRGTLVLAIVLAALSAIVTGLLSAIVVVKPLIQRVQGIGRAAAHVGEEAGYVPAGDASADEIGRLSDQLDDAHERIRAVTETLLDRNRSLESHLADIAHDLKTPLSAVQLALETLAGHDVPGRETARAGLDDCLYLAAMIDNLRVGSHLAEGGDPGADGARAEVGDLVGQVVRRLHPLARWRGVEVDRAEAGVEVWVGCQPLALERVVDNLVNNAVRYGRPGGHVAVLLAVQGGRFQLTVLDDGPGVAPDEFALLGQRRFRGAEAEQASAHGTGLGLSIVAEVCRRCGWELTFEPNDPHGLRVVVAGSVLQASAPDAVA